MKIRLLDSDRRAMWAEPAVVAYHYTSDRGGVGISLEIGLGDGGSGQCGTGISVPERWAKLLPKKRRVMVLMVHDSMESVVAVVVADGAKRRVLWWLSGIETELPLYFDPRRDRVRVPTVEEMAKKVPA